MFPETKEPSQEHLRKAEAKGNQSALKGSTKIAISGLHIGREQKETPAVSATMTANTEKVHAHPLPLQSRRRTMTRPSVPGCSLHRWLSPAPGAQGQRTQVPRAGRGGTVSVDRGGSENWREVEFQSHGLRDRPGKDTGPHGASLPLRGSAFFAWR